MSPSAATPFVTRRLPEARLSQRVMVTGARCHVDVGRDAAPRRCFRVACCAASARQRCPAPASLRRVLAIRQEHGTACPPPSACRHRCLSHAACRRRRAGSRVAAIARYRVTPVTIMRLTWRYNATRQLFCRSTQPACLRNGYTTGDMSPLLSLSFCPRRQSLRDG